MKIGIAIEETWDFLHDIYADLSNHHQVSTFKTRKSRSPFFQERRNHALFQDDLRQFMNQNEVVFFEWASGLLAAATQLPKTCGVVTRLHRYEMYRWVDQVNWDKVDKIILVSRAKQEEFVRRFPEYGEKTVVIHPSVSPEKFSFQPKPYHGDIGILCHLTPRKRVYELILDFYELNRKNSNFHLHIGGTSKPSSADYLEAITELVKKLAIEDQVTFYGAVTNAPEWYRNIDIFISNSYSEGLQVALLEAMASGCYCLSHSWPGADELLPQENLFYTGSRFQESILDFSTKTDQEKLALKTHMKDIVTKLCNVERINEQVRQVVVEVGAQWSK